jgi:hypothetical protein
MSSIITLKDLSPVEKKCAYGHYYPKEYNVNCKFCIELKENLNE